MSPLIRKEIRLVLPGFVLTLGLIALTWVVPRHQSEGIRIGLIGLPLLMLCPLFATLMPLSMFGTELNSGMCSSLLAQPIARQRIWWTKILLLIALMSGLWYVWWRTFTATVTGITSSAEMAAARTHSILLATSLLSGGLWTTLLIKNIFISFWLTVVPPAFLYLFTEHFLVGRATNPDQIYNGMLGVYAFAGVALAYRSFLRLQDAESPFGTASITDTGKAWLPSRSRGEKIAYRPAVALLSKELRLHQGLFGMGLGMIALHLGVLALRAAVQPTYRSPTFDLLCGHFWAIWLVFPLLIGCQLFAEERRLGLWGNQLSLPYRRSHQLWIKGLVACVLVMISGALLPVVLEQNQLLSDSRFDSLVLLRDRSQLVNEGSFSKMMLFFAQAVQVLPFHPEPIVKLTLISSALLVLSGFASSMTRSFFQALTAAFAGIVGLLLLTIITSGSSGLPGLRPFGSLTGLAILIPALISTLLWLTFRNAYQVEVKTTLWWRNASVILLTLLSSGMCASLVYYRAWERLTQMEPPHGTAALRVDDRISITAHWRALTFNTADGRSWSAGHEPREFRLWDRFFADSGVGSLTAPIFPVQGSNWAELVHCALDVVGIQKDGSLWVSDEPQLQRTSARSMQSRPGEPIRMVRFGKNQDWKQAVPFRSGALLLATNGTLWVWEKPKIGDLREYQGLAEEVPAEISSDAEWTELRKSSDGWVHSFVLLKKDGSAWMHPSQQASLSDRMKLDQTTELSRAYHLDSGRAPRRAGVVHESDSTKPFQVGINREGQLEIVAAWQSSHDARRWSFKPTRVPLRKEGELPWIDVASGGDQGTLVTLRADGTLWKWRFPTSPIEAPETANASRLGIHSDWVALAAFEREIITLAADGSLWAWQFESRYGTGSLRLLAPSSKPRLLGNILATAR